MKVAANAHVSKFGFRLGFGAYLEVSAEPVPHAG